MFSNQNDTATPDCVQDAAMVALNDAEIEAVSGAAIQICYPPRPWWPWIIMRVKR